MAGVLIVWIVVNASCGCWIFAGPDVGSRPVVGAVVCFVAGVYVRADGL